MNNRNFDINNHATRITPTLTGKKHKRNRRIIIEYRKILDEEEISRIKAKLSALMESNRQLSCKIIFFSGYTKESTYLFLYSSGTPLTEVNRENFKSIIEKSPVEVELYIVNAKNNWECIINGLTKSGYKVTVTELEVCSGS